MGRVAPPARGPSGACILRERSLLDASAALVLLRLQREATENPRMGKGKRRRKHGTGIVGVFSVSAVLGKGFGIWIRQFFPFLVQALVLFSPLVVVTWLHFEPERVPSDPKAMRLYASNWEAMSLWLGMLIGLVATGPVSLGVFHALSGKRVGFGACVLRGLARLVPVIGTLVALALAYVCLLLAVTLLMVGVGIHGSLSLPILAPLVVFVFCSFWFSVPVAVLENPGPLAALTRSARLASGRRWRIFLIVAAVLLAAGVVTAPIHVWVIGSRFSEVSTGGIRWRAMASLGGTILLTGTLFPVVNAVAYHDARVAEDGVSTEELARVFD